MNSAAKPQITPERSESSSPVTTSDSGISTPGSLAQRYRFIKEIGHGSQARVYLAKRLSDQKTVTIKQLNIESVSNWKEYDLFHRESDVLACLKIDGVARFYESIECLSDTPPCSYIVQEYIEGESLATALKTGKRFEKREVYDILIQLLNILYQLQSRPNPIIHRDIKPSNIMLTPKDGGYHVTLIDFGAVANPQVQSGGSTVAGTFGYMPPEQLMGKPEPASDIYAVAAVAVELFSGKSPADLPNRDFRLIIEPELENQPTELVNTLRRMLEPDAAIRFCNIPKLCATFSNYRDGRFTDIDAKLPEIVNFNKKLTEVNSLCEPGNIKLWQSLPDTGLRILPECYRFAQYCADNKNNTEKKGCLALFGFIFFGMWIIPGIISALIIGQFMLISHFRLESLFIPAIVLLIPEIILIVKLFGPLTRRIDVSNRANANYDVKKREEMRRNVCSLVESGRKTIATITDIIYMPLAASTKKKELIIAPDLPSFKIQYKFNPPDDARETDLEHSCIVHTDGKDVFKRGDPLPILYRIINSEINNEETVISMPFPFPVADAIPEEIIGSSKCIQMQNNPGIVTHELRHLTRYRSND